MTASEEQGTTRSTRAELTALAWPIALAMCGETVMGLVDVKLVGGLGRAALGGVGLGIMLTYLGYSIVFGIMRGVKVRTAYAVGELRAHDGIAYARAGIAIGFGIGLLMFAVGRDVSRLLGTLGAEPDLIDPAVSFVSAVTWGAPASAVLVALVNHRQALGDSRTPMVVALVGNVVNAVLAYSLVGGHFGLPALGVRGAGFSTALVQYLDAMALLALFVRDARRGPRTALGFRAAVREVMQLGGPTGLQFGAEMLAFTAFTGILGSMPSAQIASHQIALAVIRTSFLPGVAVSEAASILVGSALGQRRLDEADRVTYAALALAVSFMAACGVVFGTLGGTIVRGFTTDVAVVGIATRAAAGGGRVPGARRREHRAPRLAPRRERRALHRVRRRARVVDLHPDRRVRARQARRTRRGGRLVRLRLRDHDRVGDLVAPLAARTVARRLRGPARRAVAGRGAARRLR